MFQREQLYWQQEPDEEPEDEDDIDEVVLSDWMIGDDCPEFLERDGMTFCYACGILACPGEEEFDFCDHRTGRGCYHMESSPFNEARDDQED